ncbi:MAG: Dabb family protein [Campylobacterota bacterium]
MIVHIVFFKLKDKDKDAPALKRMLDAMPAKIPQIQKLEAGIDFNGSDRACDVALITEFANTQDLKTYAAHPDHLEVIEFVKAVSEYTKVVDYEK